MKYKSYPIHWFILWSRRCSHFHLLHRATNRLYRAWMCPVVVRHNYHLPHASVSVTCSSPLIGPYAVPVRMKDYVRVIYQCVLSTLLNVWGYRVFPTATVNPSYSNAHDWLNYLDGLYSDICPISLMMHVLTHIPLVLSCVMNFPMHTQSRILMCVMQTSPMCNILVQSSLVSPLHHILPTSIYTYVVD